MRDIPCDHPIHSLRADLLRTEYAFLLLQQSMLLTRRPRHHCRKINDDPDGDWDDRNRPDPADAPWHWQFGRFKTMRKWESQMQQRGWTKDEITKTLAEGKEFPAPNKVNPGNEAIRYQLNDKFVVRDEVTKEILQVGGEGFAPNTVK